MSYANGTTHYNLPQTIGTDKRDWSDTNQAFADLDAAVYSANNDLTAVADRVTALESDNTVNKEDIAKNGNDITAIEGRVTAVEHVANDANNAVADVRNDAEDMITAYNEKSAQSTHDYEVGQFFIYNDVLYKATQKISAGNTIIPNTNCEATNVTTQLNALGKTHIKIPYTSGTTTANELGSAIFDTIRKLEETRERLDYSNIKLVSYSDKNENWFTVYHVMSDSGVNGVITFVSFPETIGTTNFVFEQCSCSKHFDSAFERYVLNTDGLTKTDNLDYSYYLVV